MILGFYKLYLSCLKYNFSFVLDSEEYKCNCIKIILKPNDKKECSLTVTEQGYRKLFKNAVARMKKYRTGGV